MSELGQRINKPEIDEFMDRLPDQQLAYLVVEATRLVNRRLIRGQGRGLLPIGANRRKSPLDNALHRIAGELTEIDAPGETW